MARSIDRSSYPDFQKPWAVKRFLVRRVLRPGPAPSVEWILRAHDAAPGDARLGRPSPHSIVASAQVDRGRSSLGRASHRRPPRLGLRARARGDRDGILSFSPPNSSPKTTSTGVLLIKKKKKAAALRLTHGPITTKHTTHRSTETPAPALPEARHTGRPGEGEQEQPPQRPEPAGEKRISCSSSSLSRGSVMAAAGAAGPPPPLRASACLLIDGQHMRLALDSAGASNAWVCGRGGPTRA